MDSLSPPICFGRASDEGYLDVAAAATLEFPHPREKNRPDWTHSVSSTCIKYRPVQQKLYIFRVVRNTTGIFRIPAGAAQRSILLLFFLPEPSAPGKAARASVLRKEWHAPGAMVPSGGIVRRPRHTSRGERGRCVFTCRRRCLAAANSLEQINASRKEPASHVYLTLTLAELHDTVCACRQPRPFAQRPNRGGNQRLKGSRIGL
jgi:hypothetical protein